MIGILAGMGPKSTGPFVTQVVQAFQSLTGAKNDIDFPPMIIYALPTPFYVNKPIDHKLMEKTICEGLKKLESCGVSFVAMPCNTAHRYFQALKQCIKIPLLNMVDITLQRIPKSAKKVTVLGTRATLESEVYQKGLSCARLNYFFDAVWQEKVDEMLLNIKISSGHGVAIQIWKELREEMQVAGIDTVILACTDLNVVVDPKRLLLKVIDSSQALAEAIVHQWRNV
jgi:aspartate racemase